MFFNFLFLSVQYLLRKKLGWATQSTKEIIEFGVPCIHFYTMGKLDNVQQIVGSFS